MGPNQDHTDEGRPEGAPQEPGAPPVGPQGEEAERQASQALSDALRMSFLFLKVALGALVVFFLAKGVFSVDPQQIKIKLRWGAVVEQKGEAVMRPGTGWYIQWPLWEEVISISTTERTLPLESEFWTMSEGQSAAVRVTPKLNVRTDGYLVSGDANIVHVKLRARYRVRDDRDGALAYQFYIDQPEEVLRRLLMAATTKVVASMPVTEVMNPEELFGEIEVELRRRLQQFERTAGVPLGVEIVQGGVEAIVTEGAKNPSEPGAVRAAFNDAQKALSDRNRLAEEGRTEASRILSDAEAVAAEILARANGYRENLVSSARADADAMERLLPLYNKSEAVASILRDRFYAQIVEEVFLNAPGAFILNEPASGRLRDVMLMLSRTPPSRKKPGGSQRPGEQQRR